MTPGLVTAELFAERLPRQRSAAAVVMSASLHVAVLVVFALLAARIVSTIPYIRARVRLDRGEQPALTLPLVLRVPEILTT